MAGGLASLVSLGIPVREIENPTRIEQRIGFLSLKKGYELNPLEFLRGCCLPEGLLCSRNPDRVKDKDV